MSKHHHQSKAEQINNKANGAAPFHYQKKTYLASGSTEPADVQTKVAGEDSSIQQQRNGERHKGVVNK